MHNELSLWIKKILLLLLLSAWVWILYILSSTILLLVIAGFITILINPLADKWEQHGIPSWVTVIGVYITIFLLWSIVIWTLIPIVIDYVIDTTSLVINWVTLAQTTYLEQWIVGFHFHPYLEKIIIFVFWEGNIGHTLDIIKQNAGSIQSIITTQIWSLTSGGISIMSAVGWVVANWALIGVTSFLMILERKEIGQFIIAISPEGIDKYMKSHYLSIQKVCNAWIRATLILSLSIFITTYIGLSITEYIADFSTWKTFTLALIGGIMEFIPYVGPILAFVPAVIIWLGISWKATFAITILYILIQLVENNFLAPYVMSKSLNLSPFLVFIVMIIWASLGGIIGIMLAIPIAWVIRIIYVEHQNRRGIWKTVDTKLIEDFIENKKNSPKKWK